MILCIDIGNSGVKMGVLDGERVLSRERLAFPELRDTNAFEMAVHRASSAVLRLNGVIVSSVAPDETPDVVAGVQARTGVRPRVVSHEMRLPIDLAVPIPSRVGTDRICAASGALGGRRRNAIVIDVGSTITVDLVRNGQFLGGVIMPGPAMALSAMGRGTGQLPVLDPAALADHWPESFDFTEPSMVLGSSLGAVGGIREVVRYLEAQSGAVSRHVITGGGADVVAGRLPTSWIHDPDLVLRGLYRIAKSERRMNLREPQESPV